VWGDARRLYVSRLGETRHGTQTVMASMAPIPQLILNRYNERLEARGMRTEREGKEQSHSMLG
jgi:hypothetical protein